MRRAAENQKKLSKLTSGNLGASAILRRSVCFSNHTEWSRFVFVYD